MTVAAEDIAVAAVRYGAFFVVAVMWGFLLCMLAFMVCCACCCADARVRVLCTQCRAVIDGDNSETKRQ